MAILKCCYINKGEFMKKQIELLAPAGDLEKLKIAINYGADAVYIGGETLSLRAKAKNFSDDDMLKGIKYAHERGKKVYVTVNIFAHNEDFQNMKEYFEKLGAFDVDALIISDLGVFSIAKEVLPNMEIHVSTQANTTNYHSAKMWQTLGAKRVVLARELSFKEIKEVSENLPDMCIEAFVHGAMCISYSGRCLLSNYMADRDANKGECAHACRWKYNIVEEKRPNEYMPIFENERGTYIYNSKDLCMIGHIPELVEAGVTSFKIEGRIKTAFYVATIIKIYREAINDYLESEELYKSKFEYYMEEIRKCSHRDFTTGFYNNKPTNEDQIYTHNSYVRNYEFVALVLKEQDENGYCTIEQRNKFVIGDEIELLSPNCEIKKLTVESLINEKGEEVQEAPHPQEKLKLKVDFEVSPMDIFRIKEK